MRYVGNRTMQPSGGGYIDGSGVAPGDIDMDGNRIYDSAGPLNLGADATTNHSLTVGDVIIGGKLEINDYAYFDSDAIFAANKSFEGPTGGSPAFSMLSSIQNPNLGAFWTGTAANAWLIAERADAGVNFAHPQQTNPTIFIQSADATDIGQFGQFAWNRLALGGGDAGYGCVNQTISYSDFVDGGGLTGTLDLDEGIPDGAVVLQAILHTLTGFTGGANSTATITVGDGTDVDRYNTGTPSVYTTNASGCDLGVPSGTKWHDDAKTVTVTITVDNDFSTIAAGECAVAIFYFTP